MHPTATARTLGFHRDSPEENRVMLISGQRSSVKVEKPLISVAVSTVVQVNADSAFVDENLILGGVFSDLLIFAQGELRVPVLLPHST